MAARTGPLKSILRSRPAAYWPIVNGVNTDAMGLEGAYTNIDSSSLVLMPRVGMGRSIAAPTLNRTVTTAPTCMESVIWWDTLGANDVTCANGSSSGGGTGFAICVSSGTQVRVLAQGLGFSGSVATCSTNTFYHLALNNTSGSNFDLWFNGIKTQPTRTFNAPIAEVYLDAGTSSGVFRVAHYAIFNRVLGDGEIIAHATEALNGARMAD